MADDLLKTLKPHIKAPVGFYLKGLLSTIQECEEKGESFTEVLQSHTDVSMQIGLIVGAIRDALALGYPDLAAQFQKLLCPYRDLMAQMGAKSTDELKGMKIPLDKGK